MKTSVILNCTHHDATTDQKADRVIDLPDHLKAQIKDLLTFNDVDDTRDIEMISRANRIVGIIKTFQVYLPEKENSMHGWELEWCYTGSGHAIYIMIDGAPYFMSVLEKTLRENDMIPVYSFSKRSSEDQIQADGSVKKINIFRHEKFITPCI